VAAVRALYGGAVRSGALRYLQEELAPIIKQA
jgi:hypothetical protein